MRGALRAIAGIQRGERGLTLLLMITYAVTLFGLYLLKPARDSLFLSERSAGELPLVFILTAVLAVPVSLAYGRASRVWSLTRVHVGSFAVIIVSLLIWRPLLEAPGAVASFFFYAWAAIGGGLITAQFWLLGNAVCDARQAKRLFPLLSLGGIAGAALGGWVAGRLARNHAVEPVDLIILCAVVWIVALALSWLALRRRQPVEQPARRERDDGPPQPWRRQLRDLRGSRHLMLIVGIVAVSVLVTTCVDYLFKSAAAGAHPASGDLLAYLGTFYARMNVLSFVLQLLVTSRLLRGLGVGGAVLVLPVALTVGGVALVMVGGLTTVAGLRATELSLKYSLDKTSRELLYLPLPLGLKRRVKVFVDTFVERASRGLAGLLLLLMTTVLALPDRAVALVVLLLLAIWIGLALAMRRQYIQSFRYAVARRDIDRQGLRPDLRDRGVMTVLEGALASSNPREVAYALAMLHDLPAADLPAGVVDLLDHEAPQVRQRALAVLVEADADQLAPRVHDLLDDPDPAIGRLAAAWLHHREGIDALRMASGRGREARLSIREYVASLPGGESLPDLTADDRETLLTAAVDEAGPDAVASAACLGRVWPDSVGDLRTALAGADIDAVGAAVTALGRRGDRRHIADLAALLSERPLRHPARRALRFYGPVAVLPLVDVAMEPAVSAATRRAALRALARIPYQRTVDMLLEHSLAAEAGLREAAVPVLLRLRERRPELRFRRRTVERLLRATAADQRRQDQLMAQLGPAVGTDGDRLLRRCLDEARRRRFERMFQLLALIYDLHDIMGAWMRYGSEDQSRQADATEFLENLLSPHHKLMFAGLNAHAPSPVNHRRLPALRELLRSEDDWVRCCAACAIDPVHVTALRDDLEHLTRADSPLVAETAALTLDSARRSVTMLTIEKAILLESVDHFDLVESERLAAIAAITEEVAYADGEAIYRAGDASDAMYLVVDGEVALLRGEEEIARARGRESFGAWALFEAAPRMVTAVARTECRLLRIDREDFADLMAEDIQVAQSLLRSVARRLRELASRAA